jgi:hypothetical protein
MANILPPKYANIFVFKAAHGITWPATEWWRLTDRVVGQINGLPQSNGILTATNGILCYIEQPQDHKINLFLGHIEWFIPDADVSVQRIIQRAGIKAPKASRAQALEAELGAYD